MELEFSQEQKLKRFVGRIKFDPAKVRELADYLKAHDNCWDGDQDFDYIVSLPEYADNGSVYKMAVTLAGRAPECWNQPHPNHHSPTGWVKTGEDCCDPCGDYLDRIDQMRSAIYEAVSSNLYDAIGAMRHEGEESE